MSLANLNLYKFELTGLSPLLIHADIVEQSDRLMAWRKDSKNKKISVPGDDRSPAWTWQTYLYSDGQHLTMPSDNIMTALRKAGASVNLKGQTTFKSATQSGLFIPDDEYPIVGPKGTVELADVVAFEQEEFTTHTRKAEELGFSLFVKRAKVGTSKHVRVRPRFDHWSVTGQIQVLDSAITPSILAEIFTIAGSNAGLGDWRPSSKESPGRFGRFSASITKL